MPTPAPMAQNTPILGVIYEFDQIARLTAEELTNATDHKPTDELTVAELLELSLSNNLFFPKSNAVVPRRLQRIEDIDLVLNRHRIFPPIMPQMIAWDYTQNKCKICTSKTPKVGAICQ